jgi:PEP-CTERM motif
MGRETRPPCVAWEKFAHTLLATTCLAAGVGGAASASVITEGTPPAPSDFPNSFPGYSLPFGTNVVIGTLSPRTDVDWFEFVDLEVGSAFSLFGQYYGTPTEAGTQFYTFDSSQNPVGTGREVGQSSLEGSVPTPISGYVPSDGNLFVEVSGDRFSSAIGYELTFIYTPEPGTLACTGLALAGALAWRRKRAARS